MACSDVQATATMSASTSAKVQSGTAHGVSVRNRLMRHASRKEGGTKELVSILNDTVINHIRSQVRQRDGDLGIVMWSFWSMTIP